MLLLQNPRSQRVFVVGIEYGHNFLHQDGAVIEVLVDEVDGATGDFDAVGEGLLLGFEAGESGEQRRVNVENAARELLHEPRGEQAHVSGEADEVDVMLF